jgi:hypothetical protein
MDIVTRISDRDQPLRRLLWAVANRPPAGPFRLVVLDATAGEVGLQTLTWFSPSFRWVWLKEGGRKDARAEIVGDPVLFLDPALIPVDDALRQVRAHTWPAVLTASPTTMRLLDDYGANLGPDMVREARAAPEDDYGAACLPRAAFVDNGAVALHHDAAAVFLYQPGFRREHLPWGPDADWSFCDRRANHQ